jgi:hypothetical protein
MRYDSFAGQVVAVLSRRTGALRSRTSDPVTFPGWLRRLASRRVARFRTPPASDEIFDISPIRALTKNLRGFHPGTRLALRSHPGAPVLALGIDNIDRAFASVASEIEDRRRSIRLYSYTRVEHIDYIQEMIASQISYREQSAPSADLPGQANAPLVLSLRLVSDALERVREGLFSARTVDAAQCALEVARGRREAAILRDQVRSCLDDFMGADLRAYDLSSARLAGMRWASSTRWPVAWAEEILLRSIEVATDLYEIREPPMRDRSRTT